MNVHVLPVNDFVEHNDDGEDCICGPRTEPVQREDGSYGWLVIHQSLDGREMSLDHVGANGVGWMTVEK